MPDDPPKRLRPILDSLIGALLCAIAAVGASEIALGHSWQVSVPLIFVAILVIISAIFGARAGILGTVLSALVFAVFLFPPMEKIRVANDGARANLAWMLLLGISLSFLFAPPDSTFRRH